MRPGAPYSSMLTSHKYSHLLLLVFIFSLVVSEATALNDTCQELPFPQSNAMRWVLGENAMNGLSNQLFGVYSFIPVALLWNASLVVGNIYSRKSFEVEMKKYEGWDSLPFNEFYDYNYFASIWRRRGVDMILRQEYDRSCLPRSFTHYTIKRDPHFWPNKDAVLNQMLVKSSVPHPLPEKTVVQFDDTYPKFTALYNFWKGGLKNKLLLLRVHRSLRPAPALQAVADAVVAALPSPFLVAHVRLEGDFLLHEKATFERELELALSALMSHRCLQDTPRRIQAEAQAGAEGDKAGGGKGLLTSRLLRPPALYVASGLFSAANAPASADGSGVVDAGAATGQARVLLQRLTSLGFERVYTRASILQSISSRSTGNATQEEAHTLLKQRIAALAPEQAALVDLTVSRACLCFVPAHYASSFSYMAQRMCQMDAGAVLRYPEITEGNFGASSKFKQWGV